MGRSILFSFAHPDDESFSGAGLAAWCLERGIGVALVCATRGEAGKAGHPAISGAPVDLARAREAELREAARIIGITHVHLLDYRDRELSNAPPADIRRQLVTIVRQCRPDVVLTFDANGFNEHPDHIAISRFTTDALAAAADPRWAPEAGAAHEVRRLIWTPPIPPWEAVSKENLSAEPGIDFVIDISPWRERKAAALRAHRTQHLSIDRHFLSKPNLNDILSIESYRQAWGPPLEVRPVGDVFQGL
jgi:LmbE family N-acetylglucosaminyl deacetylase